MRISLEGLDRVVNLKPGRPVVFAIENKALYTRICRSLFSGEGENAEEPYSVWNERGRVTSSSAFVGVPNPLELPWDHKELVSALYSKVERLANEDEDTRSAIERLGMELSRSIERLTFQIEGSYAFAVEWSVRQHLKAFKFSAERFEDSPYIDSLISFLDFCADMGLSKPLVFANLERFLDDESLNLVFERVFFNRLLVLDLESSSNELIHYYEEKMRIDQDLLEC